MGRRECVVMLDGIGIEAVEVEEVGVGEEVEVVAANVANVGGQVLMTWGGDGIEPVDVLRHVGSASLIVKARHDGYVGGGDWVLYQVVRMACECVRIWAVGEVHGIAELSLCVRPGLRAGGEKHRTMAASSSSPRRTLCRRRCRWWWDGGEEGR